jgi:thioredoxin reductase (NADPH)
MFDIIIVGGGPAGLSAAITARQRNNSVAVISNDVKKSGLYKARKINNYPGFPDISGPELLDKLTVHAAGAGTSLRTGQVNNILPGDVIHVGYGNEILSSKSLILATGVVQESTFPGEEELLGRGVSYCATCDGMLYRGKRVCVVCLDPDAGAEAEFLESIGCDVVRIDTRDVRVNGETRVTSVTADGEEVECSGVFILRREVAPHLLLQGLKIESGHISAALSGKTNIDGVFAAGDCTGAPYQIAKAVGEGQVAALSASEYIRGMA